MAITDASDHSDEVYFLNVCHPLEPIHGYFCPPGSAACKKAKGHKAEVYRVLDLDYHSALEIHLALLPEFLTCTY